MNLTGILTTLGTLANAATSGSSPSSSAQGNGASFDQMLSQNIAQRAPQPEPAQPQGTQGTQQTQPQQQQTGTQATKAQDDKAADADKSAAPAQATQAASAGKSGDAKSAEAKPADDKDGSAADDKDALAGIPGASQAALVMQLMQGASAAAPRPDVKVAAGDAPLADAQVDAKPHARAGIIAAADDKAPRVAPDALAAATDRAGAAPVKTEESYARLMSDTLSARQQSDAQQEVQQQPLPAATLATALQQTSAAVAATQAQAENRLAPPVGSSAWDNALGQKVVWMASGGEQSASLTLNPPDLGPLQVVLAVNNNHATVNFTAQQPEVRQALEAALPRLKEMMSDAGIQLGQANVGAGTQGQSSGFAQREDSGRRERGGDAFSIGGVSSTDSRVRQGIVRIAPDGAVDTFA